MPVWLQQWRHSKNLVVFVITIAFALDTLLTTSLVPILPDFLQRLEDTDTVAPRDVAAHPPLPSRLHFPAAAAGSVSNLSGRIGMLLASKTLLALLTSPLVGKMADRFGYSKIMFVGFFLTFTSTLLFAFAEGYTLLLVARSIQGLGSAAVFAPGFGFIADTHPDEKERATAISTSYGGAIFGCVLGPAFGGAMYQFYGKTTTYVLLAVVSLVDGCLRAFLAEPRHGRRGKGATIKELLTDPYILITMGGLSSMNFTFATMEPLLPAWMMETMKADSAHQGLAFLPVFATLLLSLNMMNRLRSRTQPYWMALGGLLVIGFSFLVLPLATNQVLLIAPTAFTGLGLGLVDCALVPYLSQLVDLRHTSVYGTVYALSQIQYNLSTGLGTSLSGWLAAHIGFEWTMTCVGVICIAYAPLLCWLRNPAVRGEKTPLKDDFQSAALVL